MQEQPRFHAFKGTKLPVFANEAELECAQILDFHGIPWEYEPRTFTLDVDDNGNTLEAFTPDFYLPEQDLYLEITTMKQALVTRKNRKMRRLRELHPGIRVKLFYKSDVQALAEKYELGEAS
jgi:hypoxanthine phosphoribosyltransferase